MKNHSSILKTSKLVIRVTIAPEPLESLTKNSRKMQRASLETVGARPKHPITPNWLEPTKDRHRVLPFQVKLFFGPRKGGAVGLRLDATPLLEFGIGGGLRVWTS